MREIKTISSEGLTSYLPYSEQSLNTLMDTNKYGTPKQQMTILVVDTVKEKDSNDVWQVVKEDVVRSIHQLQSHNALSANKLANLEQALSEKELELQRREARLAELELELQEKAPLKSKTKKVN